MTTHHPSARPATPAFEFRRSSGVGFLAALLFMLISGSGMAGAEEPVGALAPKPLIDFNSPDAGKQVAAAKGVPAGSVITVDKTGIAVNFTSFQAGDADHPGIHVIPAAGKSWDLSPYGHVEVKITNTGDKGINVVMHVVPTGEGFWTERNLESLTINPGESKVLKVVFGYLKGFKPGPAINTSSIAEIFIYLYHSTQPHSFRIEDLKAAGTAGEKPVMDPIPAGK
jgi:hypothetical protein